MTTVYGYYFPDWTVFNWILFLGIIPYQQSTVLSAYNNLPLFGKKFASYSGKGKMNKISEQIKNNRTYKNANPHFFVPLENLKSIEVAPGYQVKECQPRIDFNSDDTYSKNRINPGC
jgi:hypothetical protein